MSCQPIAIASRACDAAHSLRITSSQIEPLAKSGARQRSRSAAGSRSRASAFLPGMSKNGRPNPWSCRNVHQYLRVPSRPTICLSGPPRGSKPRVRLPGRSTGTRPVGRASRWRRTRSTRRAVTSLGHASHVAPPRGRAPGAYPGGGDVTREMSPPAPAPCSRCTTELRILGRRSAWLTAAPPAPPRPAAAHHNPASPAPSPPPPPPHSARRGRRAGRTGAARRARPWAGGPWGSPGVVAGTEPARPAEDAPGGMSTCCVETVTRGGPGGGGMSALTRGLEDSALRGEGRPGGLAFEDVCGPRPEPERQRQHSGGSLPRRCPERRLLRVRPPSPPSGYQPQNSAPQRRIKDIITRRPTQSGQAIFYAHRLVCCASHWR